MLTAISGGIGSGKSVVSRMLYAMGYQVYDCDSEARRLIDNSREIKESIRCSLGDECIDAGGNLNRKTIADIVFSDPDKLNLLNKITHAAVRSDIKRWQMDSNNSLLFVETAILYQSGVDKMVDAVIEVSAPIDIRVGRIMIRNGFEYHEAMNRINAQNHHAINPHPRIFTITNDDKHAMLPQLHHILVQL